MPVKQAYTFFHRKMLGKQENGEYLSGAALQGVAEPVRPTCGSGSATPSACWLGMGLREWGVEGDGGLRLF